MHSWRSGSRASMTRKRSPVRSGPGAPRSMVRLVDEAFLIRRISRVRFSDRALVTPVGQDGGVPSSSEYMRVYVLQRYHDRMAAARAHLGGCCVICGSAENLNFHHKDPAAKVGAISKMGSAASARFWEEVDKCELGCVDHHREQHAATGAHGTATRYRRGCRCPSCSEVASTYMKNYRAKHKPV